MILERLRNFGGPLGKPLLEGLYGIRFSHKKYTPQTCYINLPKHETGEMFNISVPAHNKQFISAREINCRLSWCVITDDVENYMKQIPVCGRNGHILNVEKRDTSWVHKFSKKFRSHFKTQGARIMTRKDPTNIRNHRTNFCHHGDLAPEICALVWYLHTCTYQRLYAPAYLCIWTVWGYLRFWSNLWTECTHPRKITGTEVEWQSSFWLVLEPHLCVHSFLLPCAQIMTIMMLIPTVRSSVNQESILTMCLKPVPKTPSAFLAEAFLVCNCPLRCSAARLGSSSFQDFSVELNDLNATGHSKWDM